MAEPDRALPRKTDEKNATPVSLSPILPDGFFRFRAAATKTDRIRG